jgi:hypothetical protein
MPRLPVGFPEDVESVVRDNAASLRITHFGFEREELNGLLPIW